MTTTEEVPMPEPSCYHEGIPTAPLYEHKKLIAYADARCAKLQAERDALAAVKAKAIALCDALDSGDDARPAYLELRAAIDAAGGDQA